MTRPVLLIVLDGFGIGDSGPTDATAVAHTPFLDRAHSEFPTARIETSGEVVGLPPGQMGNSEVGHMTMGAGRVIEQDMTRITRALARGALETNPAIERALAGVRSEGATLHLMGLVSDGGVHSHVDHLVALLEHCGRRGVRPSVHAFLDGRDTPPRSGLGYLRDLLPCRRRRGGGLRARRGRRVREADGRRGGRAAARRRRRDLLQLPRRPRPRAHQRHHGRTARALRRRARAQPRGAARGLRDLHRVRRRLRPADRLSVGAAAADPRGARRREGPVAAARRGDGEVRPRHLLLQRRTRDAVPQRGPRPDSIPPRGDHLRSQARDERRRAHDGAAAPAGGGGLRLRPAQLRKPRHGGTYGRAGRGDQGGGDDRPGSRAHRPGGG
jgi:hypothetical protein